MAEKKSAQKPATTKKPEDPSVLKIHEGLEGITKGMDDSDTAARLATRGYMTAHAMRAYAGFSKDMMSVSSVDNELRANGDAVVSGDLGRVERMMVAQAITLDTIFANLAERASRQEYLKNMEIYMRLAMKAQAQCRATAEALALLKNPQPYIRQANMTTGPQQVNNSYASASGHQGIPVKQTLGNNPSPAFMDQYAQAHTGAGDFQSQPNELLERQHANILDTRAPSQASRANQTVETMGAVHRPKVKRG